MDWKKALEEKRREGSSRSETRKKSNSRDLKLSFGFSLSSFKIHSFKGGRIHYSYMKGHAIKTGSVQLFFLSKGFLEKLPFPGRRLVLASMLPLFLFTGFYYFPGQNENPSEGSSDLAGVGGIGDLHDLEGAEEAGVETHSDHEDHASLHSEEDELEKDKLLADEPAPEASSGLMKRTYVVKGGDTLSAIAQKFNVSVESIAGSSNIQALDHLRIGQVLTIPSKEGFFYSVSKGERLANILKKYKVSYTKFALENKLLSYDLLETGQEIFLPDAKPDNLIRSWMIPVASRIITSSYGWRNYPRRAFHKGLDLKARYSSVRAAKGGVVTYAGRLGGYGKVVVISHPGGYKSLYAHLNKIYVRRGVRVQQGSVIAQSGNTGYSFGAHLHFEVTYKGRHINPATILTGLRYKRRR